MTEIRIKQKFINIFSIYKMSKPCRKCSGVSTNCLSMQFRRISPQLSMGKIVVITRKLPVTVWYVLSKQETYRHTSAEDLVYKMLIRSWSMGEEARQEMTLLKRSPISTKMNFLH